MEHGATCVACVRQHRSHQANNQYVSCLFSIILTPVAETFYKIMKWFFCINLFQLINIEFKVICFHNHFSVWNVNLKRIFNENFRDARWSGVKFTPQQSGGPKLKIWASIKSLGLTHSKWGLTFKLGTNI